MLTTKKGVGVVSADDHGRTRLRLWNVLTESVAKREEGKREARPIKR